ncbi:GNAT family N-acetyltransferase [Colwellia psychrerythraea]|uniref:GCN5-related N-acetyltransferase n=1 Tax=Colwellia psychrerythraea TaxID=28229 RepID=A0A099KI85_COLPS|nr:GNAT family N-acetyltransferase [Colwellia psychrerythraea]KGJ89687.1 GCN5-related N-acetyltransferase [Colwellia psychrerythraea]
MQTLATERLIIRPLTKQDKALYITLYTDAKVMRNICPPLNKHAAEQLFESSLKQLDRFNNKRLSWVLIEKASQQAIGIQGITWDQGDSETISIGIMLTRSANGKLIPEEAMGALIEYSFKHLKINKINAEYQKINLATARFVKKLGFIAGAVREEDENQDCHMQVQHIKQNYITEIITEIAKEEKSLVAVSVD